ncbi:uncharacterized protein VTP21DRAFT_9721 [Calcarisporiella thermophila]|uniref:uncharacterized protein n=1 Tax=Calcarisporiella thermophila TaxID=911321 RepID=UPI00374280B7
MASLDMSLDDIITNDKAQRRAVNKRPAPGRSPRRGVNKRSAVKPFRPGQRAAPYSMPSQVIAAQQQQLAAGEGSKIVISNLHFDVTETDLKELFSTQIGPLRKVNLNYDQNGRSKGTASVVFQRAGDAAKAFDKFHNVTLDGRPMKIEMVLNPGSAVMNMMVPTQVAPAAANAPKTGGRGGRPTGRGRGGRGGRGGRRRGGGDRKQAKSAAELDAEMDSYMQMDK